MPMCVVKHCKNDSNILSAEKGVSFHRFPKDENMRNKWIEIIRENRKNDSWCASLYSLVCSIHFKKEDRRMTKNNIQLLYKHAIPTENLTSPVTEIKDPAQNAEPENLDILVQYNIELTDPQPSFQLLTCEPEPEIVDPAFYPVLFRAESQDTQQSYDLVVCEDQLQDSQLACQSMTFEDKVQDSSLLYFPVVCEDKPQYSEPLFQPEVCEDKSQHYEYCYDPFDEKSELEMLEVGLSKERDKFNDFKLLMQKKMQLLGLRLKCLTKTNRSLKAKLRDHAKQKLKKLRAKC